LGGGRGLGHFITSGLQKGVHLVDTAEEVYTIAKQMLGDRLVTAQSGADGFPCNAVYLVDKLEVFKEMYLSITLDRNAGKPVIIYSAAGGMSIEEVAEKTPEKIYKLYVDINEGLLDEQLVNVYE
jgi:succinyl-CoA synthetase beta subunit